MYHMKNFQTIPNLTELEIVRFWNKVNITEPTDCWNWRSINHHGKPLRSDGYPCAIVNRKSFSAKRVAWTITYGCIPCGLSVLHKCDNRRCVNPYHLYLGTQSENMRDRVVSMRRKQTKGK